MADSAATQGPWVARAPLRVLLAAGLLGWFAAEVLLTAVPAPLWARTGALYSVQLVALSAAVRAAAGRRRREVGRGRAGWTLLGGGLATVGASNAFAWWAAVVHHDLAAVSWRDGLSALGLLAFAAGLAALCGGAPLASRWLSLLDTVMVAGACSFVVWQTLLTRAGDRQEDVLDSYLGGLALLLLLALLLAARWRGDGRTLLLLGGGLGVEVVTLVGLAVLSAQGHAMAMDDPRVGAAFPVGTALLALAAAQRPAAPATSGSLRLQWDVTVGLPLASGGLVAVTAVGRYVAGHGPPPRALALAAGVGVLLFVRQAATLLENRRLALSLEEAVAARTAELEESRRHFRDVVQHSSDVIIVLSSAGDITYASPAVVAMLGRTPAGLVGTPAAGLVHPDDVEAVLEVVGRLGAVRDGTVFACRAQHADGSWRSVEATVGRASVVADDQTYVVNVRDVTERKLLEERLRYQAYHDPLTGLANRALIAERMRHALLRARRSRESTALVFVDLDDFKRLNDLAGHTAGDEALVHVAEVIRTCIRPHDTAARLGGDEFAVLLEGADEVEGEAVAERIVQALAQLPIPHQRAHVAGASVGVSVAAAGDADSDSLLRDADLAMYQAKASGRGRAALFRPGMREQLVQELALEGALRAALDAGDLRVAYQPIVDLRTRELAAVEALVRWRDGSGAEVPPSLFVPLAEQVGLIGGLDRFVLGESCRWLSSCPDLDGVTLNVNLSARDLDDDVERWVVDALDVSGLAADRLMLEITETAVLPELDDLACTLAALRRHGIRVSLDDFGTGYSSIASLRQLPLDEIKIDGSFVAGLPDVDSAARVVEGIISLARSLGLPVVAEAVETLEQSAQLRRFSCDYVQGWLFAPSMAGVDLVAWATERERVAV